MRWAWTSGVVAAVLGLTIGTQSAAASVLVISPDRVATVSDNVGEPNNVRVGFAKEPGYYRFADAAGLQLGSVEPGFGCTVESPLAITCPPSSVVRVVASLNGDGDFFAVLASSAIPPETELVVKGGAGNDTIAGRDGPGTDLLRGGSGRDLVDGFGGQNHLYGGNGNDFLDGGHGSDRIFGGRGDDLLIGRRGNDSLNGGRGRDQGSGGPGRDTGRFLERQVGFERGRR